MLKDYLVKESSFNRLTFQTDARLAPHTTFGIGGHADYLVAPQNEEAHISWWLFFVKKRFVSAYLETVLMCCLMTRVFAALLF